MTPTKKWKFALIGCGRIAQAYKDVLSRNKRCLLVGVADVDKKKAGVLAELARCEAFTDYQKLHRSVKPDFAVIATPPDSHMDIAAYLLQNGVHTLCEKPLAFSTKDAESLFSLSDATGVSFMMAAKFRYVDDLIKAKGLVESDVLGEIVHFRNTFFSRIDMEKRWNSNPAVSGGGVLIDNGSHAVDIVRYLFGPLDRLLAFEGVRRQSVPVEDTAYLQVRTVKDVVGSIDLSWSADPSNTAYLEIYGTHGTLSVGWNGSVYRLSGRKKWTRLGPGYDKAAAFNRQVDNFLDWIERKAEPRITGEDAVASVKTIEAAYRSMRSKEWEPV